MNSRNQALDVLRGVAILLVFGNHLTYYHVWNRAGWIGVDLFFVLSGFLVSSLLFQEYKANGDLNIDRFILRRGLKIWPSFYALIVAVSAVALWHGLSWKIVVKAFAFWSLFLQNYWGGPDITSHTWSLCVEEHFYLMLPLLLWWLIQGENRLHFIPGICAVLMAACLTMRVLTPLGTSPVLSQTHLRIDSLFCGVALGYWFHFRQQIFTRLSNWRWMPILAVCPLPAFIFEEHTRLMQGVGITFLMCGFSLLVAWAVPRQPWKLLGPLASVGRYSYSIYIWHLPIVRWLRGDCFVSFWSCVLLCIAAGVVMAKLIEFPALHLRERLLPQRSTADCIPVPEIVEVKGANATGLCSHA